MYIRKIYLLVFVMSLVPASVFADFYRYQDDSGGVNVTNDFKSVPERYRNSVTVVKDSDLAKKQKERDKNARSERAAAEQQLQRNTKSQISSAAEPSTVATPSNDKNKTGNATENPNPNKNLSWMQKQLPLLKISALIALFIAAAVVAGKLISNFVPKSLSIIIKIALFLGVIVYVFNAYSEKVAKAFAVLKSETEVVQKAVDKRTERIEKQDSER